MVINGSANDIFVLSWRNDKVLLTCAWVLLALQRLSLSNLSYRQDAQNGPGAGLRVSAAAAAIVVVFVVALVVVLVA